MAHFSFLLKFHSATVVAVAGVQTCSSRNIKQGQERKGVDVDLEAKKVLQIQSLTPVSSPRFSLYELESE